MIDVTTYAPPSDSMAVFCAAVKARLDQLGMSQSALARRLGHKDSSDLSKRLNGKKGNCSLKLADDIARTFGYANMIEMMRDSTGG